MLKGRTPIYVNSIGMESLFDIFQVFNSTCAVPDMERSICFSASGVITDECEIVNRV